MVNEDEPMTIRTNERKKHQRVSRRGRFVSATLFTTTLAMCFAPTGCAVSDAQVETPPQPSPRSIPSRTINSFGACANEGVSRLSWNAYDIRFEVQATAEGVVQKVVPKGNRLDDAAIETCMIEALERMPVDPFLRQDEPFLMTSQSILPQTRSLIGNAALLPQAIELVPIVLTTPAGVTIVVAVVVVVAVAAVVATMSAECTEEWRKAKDKCAELLDWNDPPYGVTGGYVDTRECARGLVHVNCGGNRVDEGGQPARPGRRT